MRAAALARLGAAAAALQLAHALLSTAPISHSLTAAGSTGAFAAAAAAGRWRRVGDRRQRGRSGGLVMSSASQQAKDLPGFVAYAQEALGVKLNNVNAGFINGIRGITAPSGLQAKMEFITIPAKSCLITTTDQLCPFPKWIERQQWRVSPWYVRLGLILLHERSKGAESPLAPWIAQLPRDTPTPLTWTDAERAELHYPALVAAVDRQREEWSGIYNRMKGSDSPGMAGITRDDLYWAMGIAYSRAFSGPYEGRGPSGRAAEVAFVAVLAAGYLLSGLGTTDQVANGALAVLVSIPVRDFFMSKMAGLKRYALTPVIDFANHGGNESGEVAYNYFYDSFFAMAGRDFSAGQEVLISYGQRSNDHLLQYYGFVERDNPHDAYVLQDLVPKAAACLRGAAAAGGKAFDESREAIASSAALGSESATLVYCRKGLLSPQSDAAMPALRLLALDDRELGGRAATIGLEDFKTQISEANERAAWALAAMVAEAELATAPTTLAADTVLLSGNMAKGMSEEQRLAVAFRVEKAKTLAAGAKTLRAAAGASVPVPAAAA